MARLFAWFTGNVKAKGLLVGLMMLSLVSAACGGSSSPSPTSKVTQHLSVASDPVPLLADTYIADEEGFFRDYGLDVSIESLGSTAVTEASAGEVDIAVHGPTSAFPPTNAGHQMVNIYEEQPNLQGAWIVVKAGSPYKTLMSLGGTSTAVLGVGGSTYESAVGYSKYIVAHGGKPLTIVSATSIGAITADLVAGTVASSVGEVDNFAPYIVAGKVSVILSGASKLAYSLFPQDLVGTSFMMLASILEQKPAAVSAFVRGLKKADEWMHSHTIKDIATVLERIPAYSNTFTMEGLQDALVYDKPYNALTDGYISQAAWNASLKAWNTWGLGFSLSGRDFSYKVAVAQNMMILLK